MTERIVKPMAEDIYTAARWLA